MTTNVMPRDTAADELALIERRHRTDPEKQPVQMRDSWQQAHLDRGVLLNALADAERRAAENAGARAELERLVGAATPQWHADTCRADFNAAMSRAFDYLQGRTPAPQRDAEAAAPEIVDEFDDPKPWFRTCDSEMPGAPAWERYATEQNGTVYRPRTRAEYEADER